MGSVTLTIGGRSYQVSCRDGGEEHLGEVAALIDAKVSEAGRAVGGVGETRQLLYAALLLGDELHDLRGRVAEPNSAAPAAGAPDPALARALENLADRVEALADGLEGGNMRA